MTHGSDQIEVKLFDRWCETGAAVKFLSFEPLLGSLAAMDVTGIDWVIAGGESGLGSRAM